jgi:hypothetical protein
VDVWGAILVLVRRFYITVPLAAITLFGAYMFAHSIQPEYQATSSMILLGPPTPAKGVVVPSNPIAGLGTSGVLTTLQIDMSSPQVAAEVAASGNSTNYTIGNVTKTSILTLTSTASTPARAVAGANQLASLVQADLANRQNPYTTDKAFQMTAAMLAPAQLATADTSSRTKTIAIVGALAVIVTILVVLVIDATLVSRNRKRRQRAAHAGSEIDDETTPSQQRTTIVRS